MNPYEPPKSRLELPRAPGSIIKAVLIGVVTDIGGTAVVELIFGVGYGLVLSAQGMREEEIQKAMAHIDPLSGIGLIALALGLTMSVIGGFVCARIANRQTYLAVGIQSAISVAYGTMMGVDDYEWRVLLALNLLGLAATFFGGWLYIRKFVTRS
jgi:hypothetical protein